jgi:hypothetical protein
MCDIDRVWSRIHDRAQVHARENALLSTADARRIVLHICGQECSESPPELTIEYLARELVRLTLEGINPSRRYGSERGIA